MDLIIFPHQLFANHPGLALEPERIILIEDSLFFGDVRYPAQFHKQKLWLHRASMKRYEAMLQEKGHTVEYLEYEPTQTASDQIASVIKARKGGVDEFAWADPVDFILSKRLDKVCREHELTQRILPSPMFLNSAEQNVAYRDSKKRWLMADFYKWQRQRKDILLDGDEPEGGKWSFDDENRKKIPKKQLSEIPANMEVDRDSIDEDARQYVEQQFPENPGHLDQLFYVTSHRDANRWLKHFLEHRFSLFGDYEDAIEEGQSWLWHSVLTPALNTGLLTPDDVVTTTLQYIQDHEIPINSTEGFIRQIIGWREFMRATYEDLGVKMRTTNHWQHHRSMPNCFYDATTGVDPVDDTIRRLLDTGYCHHIERLMVLGGFMFLCEIDPDDIYLWFMEMFIDSYDWVMVPNVYAMSQHADGGSITTKPYFSGSAYVRKMSHYRKAAWCEIWDGLYWRFIWKHADELQKNPRWAMMCSMVRKMDSEKRDRHLVAAEQFLGQIH